MDFKRILTIAVCVAAVSCNRPFSMDLDLAVNRDDIKLATEAGKDYFVVYSTGSWDISMEPEADWITLSAWSGKGEKIVYLSYDENPSVSRAVSFTVTSGSRLCEVYVAQQGAPGEYVYTVLTPAVTVLAPARTFTLPAVGTLPGSVASRAAVSLDFAGETPWISNVRVSEDAVVFDVDAFAGDVRSAEIALNFPVAYWDSPVTASILVTQTGEMPDLSVPETVEASPNGEEPLRIPVATNINPVAYSDWTFDYSLTDVSWLKDIVLDTDKMLFTALPLINNAAARSTTLTILVKDANGQTVLQGSTLVTQEKSELTNIPGGDDDLQPYDPEVEF